VLYGGDGSTSRETWAYDFNANTWSRLNPPQNPGSLSFLAMAYDVASDRVVLFGGFTAGVRSADTWVYDLDTDTWTRMSPAVKPSPRQEHAMTYDTQSDRVVLFGGCAGLESQCNDETWAYDFETDVWTLLAAPPSTPLWFLGVGIGAIVAVAIAATWFVVKRRRGRPPRP